MSLFNSGDFILHSGKSSNFLIDCDSLTDEDLAALAKVKSQEMVPFSRVIGIANGGTRFAMALMPYAVDKKAPTLIVDDVLTTGTSMEEMKNKIGGDTIGLVIFARTKPNWWIRSIFECSI
jgi:orotate phosphoribosyltransferase